MSKPTRQFRDALGCFATGVTVVTTRRADGAAVGITANSFSSVSLDPPLVLWCLDNLSETFNDFQASPHFAVNILSSDDEAISQDMARPGDHILPADAYTLGKTTGMPLIERAIATFECAVEHRYAGGDHVILVGRVLAHSARHTGDPLLYFRGKYARLAV